MNKYPFVVTVYRLPGPNRPVIQQYNFEDVGHAHLKMGEFANDRARGSSRAVGGAKGDHVPPAHPARPMGRLKWRRAMPKVRLTRVAMTLVRSHAGPDFKETATKRPDGDYDVPLEDDTLERISQMMLAGESVSDCIVRIISTTGKGLN